MGNLFSTQKSPSVQVIPSPSAAAKGILSTNSVRSPRMRSKERWAALKGDFEGKILR